MPLAAAEFCSQPLPFCPLATSSMRFSDHRLPLIFIQSQVGHDLLQALILLRATASLLALRSLPCPAVLGFPGVGRRCADA